MLISAELLPDINRRPIKGPVGRYFILNVRHNNLRYLTLQKMSFSATRYSRYNQ